MVIFGAGGDLTKRKLLPAICNLAQSGFLPEQFAIIAFSSGDRTTENFRKLLTDEIAEFAASPVDTKIWQRIRDRIYYVRGDAQDSAAYQRLKTQLAQVDKDQGTQGNRFFYLAVAPKYFSIIVRQLGAAGLTQEDNGHWSRVIIEKPFGRDLASAQQLNRDLQKVLKEHQIYRIDHYLGKETVQNIMVFRFGNSIFEPIWNRRYIDHVQITAAETVGVEHRGSYYETSGALRDMVPNHLFQLLSLTAMEPPISFDADAVRGKQAEILHAVPPLTQEEVRTEAVRGQYGEGICEGERVPAYRNEPDVAAMSITETFIALKLAIDNWRWADVPFYLRTGKRMAKHVTEIVIQFRRTPFMLFRNTGVKDLEANKLVLHIQPGEGISLRFGAKIPGPVMKIGPVNMDFDYARDFGSSHSTGYERLLHDCMLGDPTLFQHADMVETGWSVIQPVLDYWKSQPAGNFPNYASGSWGPAESTELLKRDCREWRDVD
jgi:glucose-6-phosphate 1-dehydrogenase